MGDVEEEFYLKHAIGSYMLKILPSSNKSKKGCFNDYPEMTEIEQILRKIVQRNKDARLVHQQRMDRLRHAYATGSPLSEALEDDTNSEVDESPTES